MRKIIKLASIIMIASMLLMGCSKIESAESVVNEFFSKIQNIKIDEADEYIIKEDMPKDAELELIQGNDEGNYEKDGYEKFSKLLYGDLKYSIISSKENSDGDVIVTTEIETYNMLSAIDKFIERYTQVDYENYQKEENEKISQNDLKSIGNHIIKDVLNNEELVREKNTIDITLKRKLGVWKIEMSEPLFRIFSVGTLSY
ncbi:hypothetical protein SAMN02745196_02284 [Clostridium collagenovorans DSM 3089]|uniref:Uncharacterized protein n=1 Tax=Clostridium collagenovorans DSM 3089 TaxID=1121306 RepID=A0A1M5XJC2_9CLOT|nr:DUF4878 domain-containing protein [Clostridium collagenovorans]SHH99648.1 hypothetical protein SAMN02745196_02284 [Clostridium collagenovorans DSM 3089]